MVKKVHGMESSPLQCISTHHRQAEQGKPKHFLYIVLMVDVPWKFYTLPSWTVHCCYVHVCFVQVTTCGAPDGLTRLGVRIFLLLSHLLDSQNKHQLESAHTEVRQRVRSAKQVSKLSLGQNKHRQNITTPDILYRTCVCVRTTTQ